MFRALRGLGDMLCLVPTLRALRAALPDAHVTLVGLASAAEFVERFGRYLDAHLEFPGFPGIPETEFDAARTAAFLTAVQGRFDLALQLHGSGTHSNAFTLLLGAPLTAGSYPPGLACPDQRTFIPVRAHEHEVWRSLRVLEHLGIPLQGDHLEFPLQARDHRALALAVGDARLEPGRYVCLHPGAHEEYRRWPAEAFAEVGDALAGAGYRVVLTGTANEAPQAAAVAARMRSPALDLAGRTGLGALAALLHGARLLVTNDTGVSHLAAAVTCPSVVVFLASERRRWAPLDATRHRAVGDPPGRNACRHCSCLRDHRCLGDGCTGLAGEIHAARAPTPDEVIGAAIEQLQLTAPASAQE